ncbi:gluzincin family metallopeptidase [Anaerocolumna xylanovorans]|uniref:Peptidase MA superfamily protein n=1 Tax=Anaerocolumna xylanovorans DSM 12503 TaxID=1121345 RepID=A0A1M7YN69_9FIRM|nr:hypothetical protein [Anaerocolumna xylanovorans]SHO54083.1 hypothetical protein SAMN02745217_04522 [Anaerocolumna xylanovorans DSM 12503]
MNKRIKSQKEKGKISVIGKAAIFTGGFFLFAIVIITLNFIPAMRLKEPGMKCLKGTCVKVYYEKEKEAAEDVFHLAEERAPKLMEALGINTQQKISIYIYDSQKTMQCKKYGYLALFLHLDWYIGDNIKTKVILTSPANPGKVHQYNDIQQAVLHEMVHACISTLNPGIRLWLTEGMALYLANGEPFYKEYLSQMQVPSYKDTGTKNPVKFSDMGGYTFSTTYIEYLKEEYGWDSVIKLIKTEDWKTSLGKSEREIYNEWMDYLKHYYQ